MKRTRVFVECHDDVVLAGLTSILDSSAGIEIVEANAPVDDIDVTLAVMDENVKNAVGMTKAFAEEHKSPVVLVTGRGFRDSELVGLIKYGVVAILPRKNLTADQLRRTVRMAADGHGSMPPAALGLLLKKIKSSLNEQQEISTSDQALVRREIEVIRLLADGLDTNDVADALHFSERTVKNVIHGALRRFDLNNRTHLVAFSIRNHLI